MSLILVHVIKPFITLFTNIFTSQTSTGIPFTSPNTIILEYEEFVGKYIHKNEIYTIFGI